MKGYYRVPTKEEKNPLHETPEWINLQVASRLVDTLCDDVSKVEYLSNRYPTLGFGDPLINLKKKLDEAKMKLNKANEEYLIIEEQFVNGD